MKKSLLTIAVTQAFVMNAYANEPENDAIEPMPTTDLGVMEVIVPYAQKVGTQRLESDDFVFVPKGNGNVTELLKSNPNVTFSSHSGTSNTGGEIAPDEISFHGERFYNNNFTIDGLSNNDNLNPASYSGLGNSINQTGQNPWDLPAGGTQSYWMPTELIKEVNVYDSNVSAQYGNFTGGVVDAQLKDPSTTHATGKISYRTARSDWDKQHIAPSEQEEFEEMSSVASQKEYTKHEYSLLINQPISDRAGIIFGYNRTTSAMPYRHTQLRDADQATATVDNVYRDEQERKNETFFLKGVYHLNDTDDFKLTLMYSPHSATFVRKNLYNSRYTNTGGGYRANFEWNRYGDGMQMTTNLAYSHSQNEIEHAGDQTHLYRRTNSIPYRVNGNVVSSGGAGNFSTEKDTLTVKQSFKFDTIGENFTHDIIAGWQYDHAIARYEREHPLSLYSYVVGNPTRCEDDACIVGEQYANRRFYYYARNLEMNDSTYSAYIEDKMNYKNLEVTLGLRADHNNSFGRTNISPRLSLTYDMFGDGNTRLFGGANRYYGNSLLAYKFRQATGDYLDQRRTLASGVPTDWDAGTPAVGGGTRFADSGVKTPYSDEWVIGLSQRLFGMNWTAKWVHRDSKDQLTRTTQQVNGVNYRVLANDGWSETDTYTLDVSPASPLVFKYATVNWGLGLQRSTKSTNYIDYNEDDAKENGYYNGNIASVSSIEPTDYHVPESLTLSINTEFPEWNITWGQRLRYEGARNYTEAYSELNCATTTNATYKNACLAAGETGVVDMYRDTTIGSKLLLDWSLGYEYRLSNNRSIGIDLDIKNVLDKVTGLSNRRYAMGRSFWLGVSYNW